METNVDSDISKKRSIGEVIVIDDDEIHEEEGDITVSLPSNLHEAFHASDMNANFLFLEDKTYKFSFPAKPKVENMYWQYISRNKVTKTQICIICGNISHDQENKMSNVIKHIVTSHKEVVSYCELGSKFINNKVRIWDYAKKHGIEPNDSQTKSSPLTTKAKQLKYGEPIPVVAKSTSMLSPLQQKNLISECIVLGLGGISFTENPGGRHLIQSFNNGAIPRGCGRNAISRHIKKCCIILAKVLPILELTAQWVQVLSAGNSVTISLVRLACKSLSDCLDTLQIEARALEDGSLVQQVLGDKLNAVIRSLTLQYNEYFGEDYRQFYAFTVGEALDPRLFGTLSSGDKSAVLSDMRSLCTHFEHTSPNGRYLANINATAGRRQSRNQQMGRTDQRNAYISTGDEFEDFVALEAMEDASETLDKRIPLIEEWNICKKLVGTL